MGSLETMPPALPCRLGSALLVQPRVGQEIVEITEPLRLEKTSKIIRSNRHPNTPTPAKPCPEVPHPHGF